MSSIFSREFWQRPRYLGRRPPSQDFEAAAPDWVQANVGKIDRALQWSSALPSGGWYVIDDRRQITDSPRLWQIAGHKLVVWRAQGKLLAAPEACPHMGASLVGGQTTGDAGDAIICPWHGLALAPCGHGKWRHFTTYDDGVFAWVQLPEAGQTLTAQPFVTARPREYLSGVVSMPAECDPSDIIANRLDPWHGCHFHPYAFAQLRVLESSESSLTLRVAYRVLGPVLVEVDATFHTPDPRTIVMTIVAGEGVGSVVETHATPMGPGRTRMTEATLATSERPGFRYALRLGRRIGPYIEKSARRLWVDDIDYAQRRYALRQEAAMRLQLPIVGASTNSLFAAEMGSDAALSENS